MKNLRNLTQSSLRNDPINRRMQGYSFRNFRRRRWSSRCKFALLFQSNFDLEHSLEAEMGQERSRTNGAQFGVFYKENLRNDREHLLVARRTSFIMAKMIVDRPMKRRIRSTITIARDSIGTMRRLLNVRS